MTEEKARRFTYASARSGSLTIALVLIFAVESVALHAWLRVRHPAVAWCLALISATGVAWLAIDYHRLGRGAVVIDRDGLHLDIGLRARAEISRDVIAEAMQPTWKDLPVPGSTDGKDYRNLTKPAAPNVLILLNAPVTIHVPGGIRLSARRVALHLDDPNGFLEALA